MAKNNEPEPGSPAWWAQFYGSGQKQQPLGRRPEPDISVRDEARYKDRSEYEKLASEVN
jgi:hypothetical protein